MKNLKLFILAVSALFILTSFNMNNNYTLKVKVINAKNDKGSIKVAVYNSQASYMKTTYKGGSERISNGKATIVFYNVPSGTYAVSCFHDANDNNKLDTNVLGIPKEQYGFSNNPIAMFGPPSFSKASFSLNSNKTITIDLN